MAKERPIIYEPHPVTPERKAELLAQGFMIIDAIYAPRAEPVPVVASELIVGKGPRGKFYVKRGKEIITGPFDTEDDAIAAKAREASL